MRCMFVLLKDGTYVSDLVLHWYFLNIIMLQYNTKDSSVRLAYESQPHPKAIASLARETIVKVACGTNHTGTF